MKTKLDTAEAVLDWVREHMHWSDVGAPLGPDRETAEYIAKCIRLTQAFDDEREDAMDGHPDLREFVERLDAARKGTKP